MPLCDLCGKEAVLSRTEIEKARLNVCPDCAKYGKKTQTDFNFSEPEEIEESRTPKPRRTEAPKPAFAASQEDQITEGYGLIVKMAREKAKLTQEELGKAIAEKENIIQRIENGQQEPTLKSAKKLEQFLRIKLITKATPKITPVLDDVDFSETNLTIGDLLKMKLSKDSSK